MSWLLKKSSAALLVIFMLLMVFLQLTSCRKEEAVALQDINFTVIQHSDYAKFILNSTSLSDCSELTYCVYIGDSLVISNLVTDTFRITGLEERTLYEGRLEAICGADKIGQSTFSFTTPENQDPERVVLERLSIGANQVEVRWNPAYDPDSKIITYRLYLNQQLKDSLTGSTVSALSGLTPDTYYILRILTTDDSGNHSETFINFRTLAYGNGTLVRNWMTYQGYKREASWYVPATTASPLMPLIVDLHGANGNAWLQIQSSDYNRIANEEGFIHLMPQALLGTFNGESVYQWNAHFIFPWNDVSFIDYLIDNLEVEYALDTNRLYITGMSNGGFMTFFAAAYAKHKWAAIAPIAGLISTNVFAGYSLHRAIPLCYMHGSADPVVLINGIPSAEDIIHFWVENNECSPDPVVTQLPDLNTSDHSTVTVYHYPGFTSQSEVIYYIIEGGGHSVPGVEPGANMDINACEEIWRFFSRHWLQ
jgi:polyhydroxybutyrate depolymerase